MAMYSRLHTYARVQIMKITVNMPASTIASLRFVEADYFTLSDIVRMAVNEFLSSPKFDGLKAEARQRAAAMQQAEDDKVMAENRASERVRRTGPNGERIEEFFDGPPCPECAEGRHKGFCKHQRTVNGVYIECGCQHPDCKWAKCSRI